MQISKKSWLYKVAYELSDDKPEVTSLCHFFWRTAFYLFIAWPLFGVLLGVVAIFGNVLGFFIAYYYNPIEDKIYPYKNWPTVRGQRVLPIYLVFIFLSFYLLSAGLELSWYCALNLPMGFTTFWIVFFSIILVRVLYEKFEQSELVKLLKEYLLAKKQKVCPIIRFTE